MLSATAPANAVGLSFTTNATSYTSVGATTPQITVAITLTADTGVALASGESLTVSTVGVPAGTGTTKTLAANGTGRTRATTTNDLIFTEVKQAAVSGIPAVWTGATVDTGSWVTTSGGTETVTDGVFTSNNTRHYGMATPAAVGDTNTALWGTKSVYYLSIAPGGGKTVLDQGVYTVQIDLTNSVGATIQRTTIKVDFVTDPADSGAKLTAASSGQWFVGNTPSTANQDEDKNLSATITNRDGGVIRNADGGSPALSVQIADASTNPVVQILSSSDNGEQGAFEIEDGVKLDLSYGIYSATAFTAVKGPGTLTVRYGLASATASVAIALAASSNAKAVASIVGAGQVDSTDAATVPLTTNSPVVL
jgi:hypothetical protein